MNDLTHLSLFTGIGGIDLAAEAAGFKTVCQCEWADFQTSILEKRWPRVPRFRDITTLTKEVLFCKKQDETALPSLAADFPVSRFQARGNKKGLKIPATCGLKCAASLQSSSPAGCLAKMLLGSSIWGSTKRFLTWKKRATLFKHSYYQLAVSARGISAQELLSSALMFPTPLASDNNKKADGGCKYECVSFRQRDISEEEQKRRNLEPSAVGGGVLYDAGSVGRDKVKISAGGNEEKARTGRTLRRR